MLAPAYTTKDDPSYAPLTIWNPQSIEPTLENMKTLLSFLREEDGQDLIEYTLLMAFIALASAAIFINAGGSLSRIWSTASTQLANAATSAS